MNRKIEKEDYQLTRGEMVEQKRARLLASLTVVKVSLFGLLVALLGVVLFKSDTFRYGAVEMENLLLAFHIHFIVVIIVCLFSRIKFRNVSRKAGGDYKYLMTFFIINGIYSMFCMWNTSRYKSSTREFCETASLFFLLLGILSFFWFYICMKPIISDYLENKK